MTNHIISENASWTPLPRLCLQAGGSYVIDNVDTPVAGTAGINNIVPNGKNDYWTVDASAGYALDDKTDLRIQYDYYRADDSFNNSGGPTAATTPTNSGLPYGADTESHDITATITRQINKRLEVSLKYGFSKYTDATSGGQDNYEAQLVYASMKYGF
jgi:predicted porin